MKRLTAISLLLLLTLGWACQSWAAATETATRVNVNSTGNPYFHNTANSGSISVSIPADTEALLVFVGGYSGAHNFHTSSTFSINSVNSGGGGEVNDSGGGQEVGYHYWVSPATGTQTFAWDFTGTTATAEGPHFHFVSLKGVNAGALIKAGGGQSANTTGNLSSGSLTAASGDLVVALHTGYANHTSVTWANATTAWASSYDNADKGHIATGTPSGAVTVTADGDLGSFQAMYAVVVAAGAGGGGGATPRNLMLMGVGP